MSDETEPTTGADAAEVDSTARELDDRTTADPTPELTDETVAEVQNADSSAANRLLLPAILAVLLVASAAFATFIYLSQYRPDQQTDSEVATSALTAATEGTVSLLSYTPETLDQDFANARARLTGDFLNYYTQFTNDIVTPAAKQKNVKTTATVVRSAVADLHPNEATVLVFINQNTTSKENPGGSFTASAVKVGLVKSGDSWLISAFDPV